jgi:uncharacterized membrane protein
VSTGFKIMLFLHIATAIVAFAPAVIGVLPGGRDGLTGTLDQAGRLVYAPALVLTGLFGMGLIVTSQDAYEFSQTWISLAFVLWIAMNGAFHALVLAGRRQGDESRVTTGHQIVTVLLLAMLYVMIWKPGL